MFARARWPSRFSNQSGRTVREPANTGDFGRLRSHLRSSYRVHTELRILRDPVYAISNMRALKLTLAFKGMLDCTYIWMYI
jgi:hypothetical protein